LNVVRKKLIINRTEKFIAELGVLDSV